MHVKFQYDKCDKFCLPATREAREVSIVLEMDTIFSMVVWSTGDNTPISPVNIINFFVISKGLL